jgi:hypothetical protein
VNNIKSKKRATIRVARFAVVATCYVGSYRNLQQQIFGVIYWLKSFVKVFLLYISKILDNTEIW